MIAGVAKLIVQRHQGLGLGGALVDAGASWVSPIGAPHAVNTAQGLCEPCDLAGKAIAEPERRPALLALVPT